MNYRHNHLRNVKNTFIKLLLLSFCLLVIHLGVLFWQTPWLLNMRSISALELEGDKIVTLTEAGTIITNYEDFKIEYLKIDDIPEEVLNIFIAIEDTRFYQHKGVDYWGILRAFWTIVSDNQIQGGSTISQQLARNIFLNHDRTLKRKFDELIITIQLERQFSKAEILEMYLNQIHFGKQYYGISRAAKGYFNKDVTELTLGEVAILAGMPKGPNLFFPTNDNTDRALGRQQVVLSRLLDLQLISEDEAAEAYEYLANLLTVQGGNQ